ncbi:MAG: DNA replication and repair protein RecF [Puniceicoccales bacterium]|jgi:DNA replication and repair protein RecF|nr:DNA replication and repair protein RecF [Puniceicoccales bacterium]
MKLRRLRLVNFRNVSFAEVPLTGRRVFLLGANGQGKTNFLEAVSLLPALRSFRTQDTSLLIRHGTAAAQTSCLLEHEIEGETEITITVESGKKNVDVDGIPIRQFSEYLGRFPAVPFCTADIELLRSSPATRRRWLDMVIAGETPAYLEALRRYHNVLAARNQLLRQPSPDIAQLEAFEKTLAPCAETIASARARVLAEMSSLLQQLYAEIAYPAAPAYLHPNPNSTPTASGGWLELYARQRSNDILARNTQRGPHRDDFSFLLDGHPARDTASEGQQRALVLALELAWLTRLRIKNTATPIVLADDILGELDPQRKTGFWRTLGDACQVLATGTIPPENPAQWQIIHVDNGSYK